MCDHRRVSVYVPPGWPPQVRPPDAPDWEQSAASWLLDLCPPDYRAYPGLRRHVVVLARFAALHLEGRDWVCRRGLSEARVVLRDVANDAEIEAAILTWQREQAALIGLRRAVRLVEEALQGRRYRPRL